jgi:hypothetical protein
MGLLVYFRICLIDRVHVCVLFTHELQFRQKRRRLICLPQRVGNWLVLVRGR